MQLIHGDIRHAVKPHRQELILFDGLRAVFANRDFFITPNVFPPIAANFCCLVMIDDIVLVFLRMNKHFFFVFFIFKAQFIKPIPFVTLRLYRHPGFMFRQAIRWLGCAVIRTSCNYRLVRVPL